MARHSCVPFANFRMWDLNSMLKVSSYVPTPFTSPAHNPSPALAVHSQPIPMRRRWNSIQGFLRRALSTPCETMRGGGPNLAKGTCFLRLAFSTSCLDLQPSLFSHRQDWASEACFQIYLLYEAMMLYLIDAMVLEPNILRDSILVHPCPFLFPNLCVC
jgi:hypothetical protein